MGTIATVPLVNLPTENWPVLNVANGIVPDEALAISVTLSFTPTVTALLVDVSESARKFNTIPIQGVYIDMSAATMNLAFQIPASGQMILAKAGTQGYYALISPMPVRVIAQLSAAPAGALNISIILYNTPIESQIWGYAQGPIGPQGPPGPAGPQGPAGSPATLVPATATVLGGVKIGANVNVLADGTISVPPVAAFQTPWLTNINGNGFALNSPALINNAGGIGIGTSALGYRLMMTSTEAAPQIQIANTGVNEQPWSGTAGGAQVQATQPTGAAAFTVINDTGLRGGVAIGGGTSIGGLANTLGLWAGNSVLGIVFMTGTSGPNERMRITQAGLVGIGTANPLYELDVRTPGIPTQFHFSITDTDAGGYLGATNDTNLNLTAGAMYNASNWIAKATVSSGLSLYNGEAAFVCDQGLTVGIAFTPTARMVVMPSGNIGIGTSSPSAPLHVYRHINNSVTGIIVDNDGSGGGASQGVEFAAGGAGVLAGVYNTFDGTAWNLNFNTWSNTAQRTIMVITGPTGFVGIQTVPTHLLHLATDDAAKPATNTWTISSGAAVKRNVKRLTGGLEIINKLRPTEAEYNGRGGTPEGQRVVSLIAEEVRTVLPHTVTEDADGNLGFNIHEVIHHLILSVQQLSAELEKRKR